MISSRTVLALVVAPFVLVACSGASTDGEAVVPMEQPIAKPEKPTADGGVNGGGATADPCERICTRYLECDPANDAETCKARCENTNGTFLSKVNAQFEEELSACIDVAACRSLESGTAISDCTAQARARLAPSASATKFCDDYAKAVDHCGGSFDKATCYLETKIYDEDALAAATRCLGKTCADLDACVLASLGREGSASPPPKPAPSCSTKLSYTDAQCGSCMQGSCCDVDNACANESTCIPYYNCITACTTTSCASACAASYPKGKTALEAVGSCMNDRCSTSCQ